MEQVETSKETVEVEITTLQTNLFEKQNEFNTTLENMKTKHDDTLAEIKLKHELDLTMTKSEIEKEIFNLKNEKLALEKHLSETEDNNAQFDEMKTKVGQLESIRDGLQKSLQHAEQKSRDLETSKLDLETKFKGILVK